MRKSILLFFSVILFSAMQAQVIKPGKGRSVYVRVEDTTGQKPFHFHKQSMFTLSLFDVFFTNITGNYEFFRKDGKIGFQVPLSINAGGLPDTSAYSVRNTGRFLSQRNRIFESGLAINYYPNGQSKASLFFGADLRTGMFYYWNYTYLVNSGFYQFTDQKLTGSFTSGALHGGVLINPNEIITFYLRTGIGLRRYGTIYQEYTFPYMQFDFGLGFKF